MKNVMGFEIPEIKFNDLVFGQVWFFVCLFVCLFEFDQNLKCIFIFCVFSFFIFVVVFLDLLCSFCSTPQTNSH